LIDNFHIEYQTCFLFPFGFSFFRFIGFSQLPPAPSAIWNFFQVDSPSFRRSILIAGYLCLPVVVFVSIAALFHHI
jgi:hypothetical protein